MRGKKTPESMERKWKEKVKNVENLADYYRRHPLSLIYRPKLAKPWLPSSVWKLFPRQALAFNFAKTCKEDVHLFALETVIDDTERRLYLVTTYAEFWFYYVKHPFSLSHCYEVIPADAVCKLYIDFEFYKSSNPEADGKKMVALVIEYFSIKLEELYGIKCSPEWVLNLDSSSKEKFSRHLIFLLPNAAFKDNIHAGNFIKNVLKPLLPLAGYKSVTRDYVSGANESPCLPEAEVLCGNSGKPSLAKAVKDVQSIENCDLSSLIVRDKYGGNQLCIDLGVYTKNRNFRLYKASKLGKNVPFTLAEDNKFRSKPQKDICTEEHIFLCSLISNIRFSDSLKILTCSSPDYGMNKATSPYNKNPGVTIKGYQFSPYPEIDDFILSLVTQEGFQGSIRSWNYFSSEELLVYETANYRWCANIGRAHKSNNVMLLVDLKREVWYQKCHDPICRAQNYKSECYPLPPEVCLPFLFKEEDEESVFTMDENGNIKETKINRCHVLFADGYLPPQKPSMPRSGNTMASGERHSGSEIDDACILEATEDVEFVNAVDTSLAPLDLDDVQFSGEDVEFANAVDNSLAHLDLDDVQFSGEDIVFANAVDTSLAHLNLEIPDEDIEFANAVDTSLAHLDSEDVEIPDEDIEFANAVDTSLAHLDLDDAEIPDTLLLESLYKHEMFASK
ncbi:DNA-directed primase/polymerase protein isoform X1 [Xenopus laevis]|uniref:DNA-directed primase/polymerase protein n=3 Tax=Xenopus laevis TaxID=8355 RepID=A0A1L8HU35_XENLA|nr:DNA-directed primase/polymerase protein isoform X1 [Xenopus laevis]OCT99584.1 hypothetical protein XELAEV_18005366mg [Xenopus laevis]